MGGTYYFSTQGWLAVAQIVSCQLETANSGPAREGRTWINDMARTRSESGPFKDRRSSSLDRWFASLAWTRHGRVIVVAAVVSSVVRVDSGGGLLLLGLGRSSHERESVDFTACCCAAHRPCLVAA